MKSAPKGSWRRGRRRLLAAAALLVLCGGLAWWALSGEEGRGSPPAATAGPETDAPPVGIADAGALPDPDEPDPPPAVAGEVSVEVVLAPAEEGAAPTPAAGAQVFLALDLPADSNLIRGYLAPVEATADAGGQAVVPVPADWAGRPLTAWATGELAATFGRSPCGAGGEVRLVLHPAGEIHGRVLGLSPEECERAAVYYYSSQDLPFPYGLKFPVGRDGTYRVAGVRGGGLLHAVCPGRGSSTRANLQPTLERRVVDLRMGPATEDVKIRLVDSLDRPVAPGTLAAAGWSVATGSAYETHAPVYSWVGEDGWIVLRDLVPGALVTIVVSSSGSSESGWRTPWHDFVRLPWEVVSGSPTLVVPAAVVQPFRIEDEGGRPFAGVPITTHFRGEDGEEQALRPRPTGEDGSFRIGADLPAAAGRYRLVDAAGNELWQGDLEAGTHEPIRLRAPAVAAIPVRVLDFDGEPIERFENEELLLTLLESRHGSLLPIAGPSQQVIGKDGRRTLFANESDVANLWVHLGVFPFMGKEPVGGVDVRVEAAGREMLLPLPRTTGIVTFRPPAWVQRPGVEVRLVRRRMSPPRTVRPLGRELVRWYGLVPGEYSWRVLGLPGGDLAGGGLEVRAGEETELVLSR